MNFQMFRCKGATWYKIWPPGGATCIDSKFGRITMLRLQNILSAGLDIKCKIHIVYTKRRRDRDTHVT